MSDPRSPSYGPAIAACLIVWAIFCLPLWLLGMGFAGTVNLPTLMFGRTDEFLFSLIYCAFFYGLPLIAGGMTWSAIKDDLQRGKSEKTESIDA